MPSKGSPILKFRVHALVKAAIEERIQSRNVSTNQRPWDVSDYLRYVVMVDLGHRARSRRPRPGKGRGMTATECVE